MPRASVITAGEGEGGTARQRPGRIPEDPAGLFQQHPSPRGARVLDDERRLPRSRAGPRVAPACSSVRPAGTRGLRLPQRGAWKSSSSRSPASFRRRPANHASFRRNSFITAPDCPASRCQSLKPPPVLRATGVLVHTDDILFRRLTTGFRSAYQPWRFPARGAGKSDGQYGFLTESGTTHS